MEYINLFLILLTMLLLSVTSYEHFYQCKKKNFKAIIIEDTSSPGASSSAKSVKYGCCPSNNPKNVYSIVNGLCCRNKITKNVFDNLDKKKDIKKINNYTKNKIKEGTNEFYCDDKTTPA